MHGDVRLIKACLNGKRSQAEYPAVPVTPGELARDAAAAAAAGAEAIHLHARGPDSAESVHAADVGGGGDRGPRRLPGRPGRGVHRAVDHPRGRRGPAGRRGGLGEPDRRRAARFRLGQRERGRMGGSGRGPPGAAGIAVEAGVWSVADVRWPADAFACGGLPQPPLRILVEVMGVPAEAAPRRAGEILRALDDSPLRGFPRLLHGEEEGCWPLVAQAAQAGLPTRIGLEDTTAGPEGELASGNAELVRRALELLAVHRPGRRG